jgi:hypothetical protein
VSYDYTPEELEQLSRIPPIDREKLSRRIRDIKIANGISPHVNCIVCFRCEKPVQYDQDDEPYCECNPWEVKEREDGRD